MSRWISESTNQWINGSTISELMNQWISESTNQWTSGSTIWTKEPMNQWIKEICCQPHPPKVLRSSQLFWSWGANRTLATVSCTFCRPHFPKVLRACRFFNICKSSSRRRPAHSLPTTFPDRAANPRKQRPSQCFGDARSHITRKNTGFGARECSHPWIHTLPNCHASQLLDDGWLTWWSGWRNNGVDMMMWLTWCWECKPWPSSRNSELFELNFLWLQYLMCICT